MCDSTDLVVILCTGHLVWDSHTQTEETTKAILGQIVADSPGVADILETKHPTADAACRRCKKKAGSYMSLNSPAEKRDIEEMKQQAEQVNLDEYTFHFFFPL